MKFVFYDFETSGLSAPYDSIVQAAFILTDENFNILDQLEICGRMKKEYPVPHPKALIVNNYSLDDLQSDLQLLPTDSENYIDIGACINMLEDLPYPMNDN